MADFKKVLREQGKLVEAYKHKSSYDESDSDSESDFESDTQFDTDFEFDSESENGCKYRWMHGVKVLTVIPLNKARYKLCSAVSPLNKARYGDDTDDE